MNEVVNKIIRKRHEEGTVLHVQNKSFVSLRVYQRIKQLQLVHEDVMLQLWIAGIHKSSTWFAKYGNVNFHFNAHDQISALKCFYPIL